MNNDIIAIQREIKNLKIYKQKKASVLRTTTTNFSISVELTYNSITGKATNQELLGNMFDLNITGSVLPIVSFELNSDYVDGRNMRISAYPVSSSSRNYYMCFLSVSSSNPSDIADTQGGNTKTITLNFNAISTSKLTYSEWYL